MLSYGQLRVPRRGHYGRGTDIARLLPRLRGAQVNEPVRGGRFQGVARAGFWRKGHCKMEALLPLQLLDVKHQKKVCGSTSIWCVETPPALRGGARGSGGGQENGRRPEAPGAG